MYPEEYIYDYNVLAPKICAMQAINFDGSIYGITKFNHTFAELVQMGVDLLHAGTIDHYIIWCLAGVMI